MPYLNNEDNRSPCSHQKKTLSSEPYVIPITKRPIDKMTTRSQTQYQQMIKSRFNGLLDHNNKDRHSKNSNNNHDGATSFVSEKIGPINCIMPAKLNTVKLMTNAVNGTNRHGVSGTGKNHQIRHISATIVHHNPEEKQQNQQIEVQKLTNNTSKLSQEETAKVLPVTPRRVLENPTYLVYLTSHEKKEISSFPRIYFIGKKGIKKRTPHTATIYTGADGYDAKMCGFDDNNGSYIPVLNDHIAYRYEILKVIGKGTFGIVLHAHDHKERKDVALKLIRNQQRFHSQAKEEIKILKTLLDNDVDDRFNIVHMLENFMFRNHPCIIFELLSLNLYELSKKNSYAGFSIPLIRRFTYAIVNCLYALSKFDIIHCDLKPENILLKQHNRSGIKVIDFGSSCFVDKKIHTYIQSRYYRSPEVILNGKYGPAIDMWSLGCILVELYIGRPILDGEDEGDQLACMMELLNVPTSTFLSKCKPSKVKQFFDDHGPVYYRQYGRSRTHKIRGEPGSRKLLPYCDDSDFKDFIKKCLVWDPTRRLTPIGALEHPWLTKRSSSVGLVHQELSNDMSLNQIHT